MPSSPKRRGPILPLRRDSVRSDVRWRFTLAGFVLGVLLTRSMTSIRTRENTAITGQDIGDDGADFEFESPSRAQPLHLFIAIGSAPGNIALRAAARDGWLRWADSESVSYRFFTDAPSSDSPVSESVWETIGSEEDVVQMEGLGGGYGTKEHNAYGQRALWQLRWGLEMKNVTHFLRVDDDSFLCLHRLLYELHSCPRRQFFWGRYWCAAARHRADESFMLLSRDVAAFMASGNTGQLVPFDSSVTFGWNFGYMAWFLNLTIFDDQRRIDAQQGYLTSYMHTHTHGESVDGRVGTFCERYLYAHHVRPNVMRAAYLGTRTHAMYALPRLSSPQETCPHDVQSFAPSRHSSILPDIVVSRPEAR